MAKITIVTNSNASSTRALTGDIGPAKVDKPIKLPPDLDGPFGKAWRADLDAMRKAKNLSPKEDGTIAVWIIEAPWAHPVWHSYALILVHLRALDPPAPTKFYVKDATHEMWLYAFDPSKDREKALVDIVECAGGWMRPMNFGAQLKLESDAAAIKTLEVRGIKPILMGELSPDSDFTSVWSSIFGDNMMLDRADKH